MRTVYRDRTITEKMDYALQGDRPIEHFLLTNAEMYEFVKSGERDLEFVNGQEYYVYRGIPVYQE